MVFGYTVKHNGVRYMPGDDVPIIDNNIGESDGLPFEDKIYSEEELNGMTVKELKAVAADLGVKITNAKKAEIIKDILNR